MSQQKRHRVPGEHTIRDGHLRSPPHTPVQGGICNQGTPYLNCLAELGAEGNPGKSRKSGVLQPIMPLDLPVKVRPWELTVYPRSHIRR